MSTRPKPDAETAAPHHPCVLGALVEDVGRYLLGPEAPEPARRMAAQRAFRHARDDFEAFADSACAGTDVVLVELMIKGAGVNRHTVYTRSPGPLALLLVAARNCRPGDLLVLRQVTAKCGQVSASARWPFGMADAEIMTRPADVRLGAPRTHRRRRLAGWRRGTAWFRWSRRRTKDRPDTLLGHQ